MRKKIFSLAAAAAAVTLALTLTWAACDLPHNQPNNVLSVSVNVPPRETRATFEPPGDISLEDLLSEDFILPPETDEYHLRIFLTNPDEAFYVADYQPGEAVEFLVSEGEGRVIGAEVYLIPGDTPSPNTFTGVNYVTSTPEEERTISTTGSPVSVNLTMVQNPSTGMISGGAVQANVGSGVEDLPLGANCPPEDEFFVNLTDRTFGGLSFPTILADDMYELGSLQITGLPLGHTFEMKAFHGRIGVEDTQTFDFDVTPKAVDVLFTGYKAPQMNFFPESLPSLVEGSSITIIWYVTGGLGTDDTTFYGLGADDTCRDGGGVMDEDEYQFYVPSYNNCKIEVEAEDCGGNVVSGSMNVDIVMP